VIGNAFLVARLCRRIATEAYICGSYQFVIIYCQWIVKDAIFKGGNFQVYVTSTTLWHSWFTNMIPECASTLSWVLENLCQNLRGLYTQLTMHLKLWILHISWVSTERKKHMIIFEAFRVK
jgi:hypothetical protein